jgi:hypothetical protein
MSKALLAAAVGLAAALALLYLGSAKTMCRIGKAFGEAMIALGSAAK